MKNIFEIESEIDEARGDYIRGLLGATTDIGALRTANPRLIKSFEDVLSYAKTEGKPIMGRMDASSKTVSELLSVDDLVKALSVKNGLNRNSVAQFYKGLMKSPSTDIGIIKTIAPDLVGNSNFRNVYAKFATEAELIAELKKKQYSKDAIKEIVAATKRDADFINARAKFTGGGTGPAPAPGPTPAPVPPPGPGTKWKEWVKKNPYKTAAIALGALVPAYLIWNNSDDPNKGPAPKKSEGFPPCVAELIDKNKAKLYEEGNKGYAFVKTPKYPDGLKFYLDGTVINAKTGESTTYNCK